jgi:hypothetical protein
MMRRLLPWLIFLAMAFLATMAAISHGQTCPEAPVGYQRQHRPQGEPPNYPPAEEPACYMIYTNATGNYISCIMCHPHKYEPWGKA